MKHALHLLMLVSALIGLTGQGFAYAAAPRVMVTMSGMSTDCMKAMKTKGAPCKGMTLDCMAAMGCIASVTLSDPFTPERRVGGIAMSKFWISDLSLVGTNTGPEPPPPNSLD